MGRVFSFADITAGHVPNMEDFDKAAVLVEQDLVKCSHVVGALKLGSCLTKDELTRRSDLDILVIYQPERTGAVLGRLGELANLALERHRVPIQFIPVDTITGQTPCHNIGPNFRREVVWSNEHGGLIKGSPLAHIKDQTGGERDDFFNYARIKLSELQQGVIKSAYSPEMRLRHLANVLNTPVRIAYRVLCLFDSGFPAHLPKAEIIARYKVHDRDQTALPRLVRYFDQGYTSMLDTQLFTYNEPPYKGMLWDIEALAPQVIDFIRYNVQLVESHFPS